MDLVQMKASAYDLIAKIELMQRELKELNNKILESMQKETDQQGKQNT